MPWIPRRRLALELEQQWLDAEGIARIRTQATIAAEISRSTQSARTVRLIEEQYTDFQRISERFPEGSMDVLLAGILHAVDAFDAVTHPRPYQEHVPRARRLRTLCDGRGSRFHPGVVDLLIYWTPEGSDAATLN